MIPIFRPSLGEEELNALREVFQTGWIGLGPKTKMFEGKFAEYIGVAYAVGVNSATAALYLALKVLDVKGGEVITTPMTFISTNHAILYNEAIPVFADVEPDTLNIDVNDIERKITDKTKAIVVVHYSGHACNMDPIMELARDKGLKVVEDCAHACGGEYKGRKLGSIGDAGCFSFHAVKNLATGDGGMITLHLEELDARCRKLRWLGISRGTWDRSKGQAYSWEYNVEELGFKCHMNDITAAIGLVQLKKLEKLNTKRRRLVERYNEAFHDVDWIETPPEKPYAKSSWHIYAIKVDRSKSRDKLIEFLKEKNISASMHYIPNHLYPMYKQYATELPIAERIWRRIVTLPLFPDLTDDQVEYIIETLLAYGKRL